VEHATAHRIGYDSGVPSPPSPPDLSKTRPTYRTEIAGRPLTVLDKGIPAALPGATVGTIGELGWSVADLLPPVAVLRESAIEHNIETMAEYCRQHGFELAPHAKTTMAPALVDRQMAHGAWGVTVGTAFQARVLAGLGVHRIIIAHQVHDRVGIAEVARLLGEHPDVEVHVLADSLQGVALMDAALAALETPRPLHVLVELGMTGGRTGARSIEAALDIARAVSRAPTLRLAGIEGYEGLAERGELDSTLRAVDRFLDEMVRLAEAVDRERLVEGAMILSAGGSAYFDRVVLRFGSIGPEVTRVLRSGCYVTHDHSKYRRLSPLDGRGPSSPRLRAALEVWCAVVSRPEHDLVVVNGGRRDMSFDAGLPLAFATWHDEAGAVELEEWWPVDRMMDQHSMIRIPADAEVGPGDLIALGISHPCTTFDKWRVIPVVDDRHRVIDAVVTHF
jgi:D-serine dehydratase